MDRQVRVHQLAVADGHLPQGRRAPGCPPATARQVALPRGAVAALDAAGLDDAEQAVAVAGVDAEVVEALVREREQLAQDEEPVAGTSPTPGQ